MTSSTAAVFLVLAVATADPPFIDPHGAGVALGDHVTGKAFVVRYGGSLQEPDDDSPRFQFTNEARTELLQLLMHYGDLRYSFMQFRVRGLAGAAPAHSTRVPIRTFITGKGIHLGLSVSELVAALGEPHDRQDDGKALRLVYRCNARARCPALVRVNMPQYEARYVFVDGVLTAFEGGYPYP